ncbi:MAG: 4-hydroxythreonine-4-phosphate dehydrogenase PdxA [Elusimicrobiota bacterium]|nr:4-hydroxythreonine-4-phosphate dehydrogenase PdxA [Elusimicrobiota bacterium]
MNTIYISMGDPRGIGPEIIFKALKGLPKSHKNKTFVIVGDKETLKGPARKYEIEIREYNSEQLKDGGIFFVPVNSCGHPGKDSLNYIKRTVELTRRQPHAAMVTAPVEKKIVSEVEKDFVGHTEYIKKLTGAANCEMVFITEKIKISLLTRHIPLKEVNKNITSLRIVEHVKFLNKELKGKFGYKHPRFLIIGLNPHAGDEGLVGNEENEIYRPAVKELKRAGIIVGDIISAEAALRKQSIENYDFIVSSYHDQILPAIKTAFKPTVNLTLGLEFIRTSPDHGPAIDIAGKDIADSESMAAAIKLAGNLTG